MSFNIQTGYVPIKMQGYRTEDCLVRHPRFVLARDNSVAAGTGAVLAYLRNQVGCPIKG
jgi:hypothetical protein